MNFQTQQQFDIETHVRDIAVSARAAARSAARSTTEQRNRALLYAAESIDASYGLIRKRNQLDLAEGRLSGLSDAMLDRLNLTESRIAQMAEGLRQTADRVNPAG